MGAVVAVVATGFLLWQVGGLAARAQSGDLSHSDLIWWVVIPILFLGGAPTVRLGRRIWGAIIEWPAWLNRKEPAELRVFRGHPDGRYETLAEQRARRFQAAQDFYTRAWRLSVRRAADEIYGDDGPPPEDPKTPEWLTTDARDRR